MIIPEFKEKTFPVYEMDFYINEEPSDEAKQFNKILKSIKDYELIPKVSEMTAILEYEEKALNYAFKLSIETKSLISKLGFPKNLSSPWFSSIFKLLKITPILWLVILP